MAYVCAGSVPVLIAKFFHASAVHGRSGPYYTYSLIAVVTEPTTHWRWLRERGDNVMPTVGTALPIVFSLQVSNQGERT